MKKIKNTDLNIKNVNEEVTVYGWVAKKRDLGGLIFIDLRDRSGIIQVTVRPDNKFYGLANSLKSEYVINRCKRPRNFKYMRWVTISNYWYRKYIRW